MRGAAAKVLGRTGSEGVLGEFSIQEKGNFNTRYHSPKPTTRPKPNPRTRPSKYTKSSNSCSTPGTLKWPCLVEDRGHMVSDPLMHTSATVLLTRPRRDEHISHTAAPLALSGPNPRPILSHRLVLQSAPHHPISELRISELPRSKQIPPSFLAPSTSLHSRRSRHLHQSSPHPSQLG